MITFVRTHSDNADFKELVSKLDFDLKNRDRDEHAFYAQLNKTKALKTVVVAYDNNTPVGCGAFREIVEDTAEIKRMYVEPDRRGQGIASKVLAELEKWSKELNYKKCILETGKKQPEAIALYKKSGYAIISNYGSYANVENSICFEKQL